mgnify:CR=1 FL=1
MSHNEKRIATIRESITKIARILTGNKVIVTQSGVKAFIHYDETTMKASRVNLPMIPDDATDELIEAVQGFLDSEISKVLFSDSRSSLRAKYDKLDGIYKPIESLYCEKEMIKEFPGSRNNLANMHETFVQRFIEPKLKEAIANGASEQQLFQVLAIPALRAWGGSEFFKNYMKDKWSLIAGIQEQLDPVANKISKINKPEDCYEMAREIRKIVEGEGEPGEDSNPFGDESDKTNSKGKGSNSGGSKGKSKAMPNLDDEESEDEDEDEGESSGGEKADAEEGESDEEGSGGAGEGDDDEAEGESEGGAGAGEEPESDDEEGEEGGEEEESGEEGEDGSSADESDDEPVKAEGESDDVGADKSSNPTEDKDVEQCEKGSNASALRDFNWDNVSDMSNEFGQHVTDLCTKEMKDEGYTVFTREWDEIAPPKIPSRFDDRWMTNMEESIEGMVGPVARQLERAFTARNKSLWQQGQTKGKMSSGNLYRLTAGDDKIFKKKIEHRTSDIAVSLVVDCSGAMSGRKIYTAMCAAWVVSEVLTKLGVDNEVIGFTTMHYESDHAQSLYRELSKEYDHGRSWDRCEPIRMPVFKAFSERFGIEQKKRMASYMHINGSLKNNVDGESVQYAYDRLAKQASKGKPKGKTMIVFSDGMPAAAMSSSKLNNHLKEVVKRMEKEGTNVVGVGICSDSVQHFYRKNVKMDNVEELPGIVLTQLRDALLAA